MKTFSLRSLQENCAIMEKHILVRRLATPDELQRVRPGSAENPGKRAMGAWVRWYGELIRFLDRESLHDDDRHTADGIGLDILRAEPQLVTLTALDSEGQSLRVSVYPKSLDALLQCHAHDHALGWLAERAHILRESDNPQHAHLVEETLSEIAYQHAVLVWIVTSPGPQSPIRTGTRNPEPPDWILALEPWDVLRIAQAHAVVNAQRLQAMEILLSPDTDDPAEAHRPSWSIFAGDLAIRLNTSVEDVMSNRTLAGLLAAIKANASVQRDAMRAAKAKEPHSSAA